MSLKTKWEQSAWPKVLAAFVINALFLAFMLTCFDPIFETNDDVRNWVPQLSRENIAGNQPIIDLLGTYAELKQATRAQISLAWMLKKFPNVVPIPGSKNKELIIENLDAAKVKLTDEEFASLEEALNQCRVYGHRGLGGF